MAIAHHGFKHSLSLMLLTSAILLGSAGCVAEARDYHQAVPAVPVYQQDRGHIVLAQHQPQAAPSAQHGSSDFSWWKQNLIQEAVQKGISPNVAQTALSGLNEPIDQVIRLDKKQPESTITWPEYKKRVVSEQRILEGRAMMRKHRSLLEQTSARFGVPAHYIVALWGIETSYGKITGNYDIPHALATLAYEGRRADFFRSELIAALQILQQGHIRQGQMIGSWAGAMGQCQFMPTSFLRLAVDGDGDGKKDIWNNLPDVFASIANYLAKSGWKPQEGWGRAVKLPANFNKALEGRDTKKTIAEWQRLGVRNLDGSTLAAPERTASIVIPKGSPTAYLTYSNYDVIMKWNRSTYFATAVGQLADKLAEAW